MTRSRARTIILSTASSPARSSPTIRTCRRFASPAREHVTDTKVPRDPNRWPATAKDLKAGAKPNGKKSKGKEERTGRAAIPPGPWSCATRRSPLIPMSSSAAIRGRPGKAVPRQFLKVLAGPQRKPFQKGSGRLELAEAIVTTAIHLPLGCSSTASGNWHFGKGW